MVETEVTILINRKSDIDIIRQKVADRKIQVPIYILEFENHYQLNFVSNYEEWELDSAILEFFSDYEFTTNLARGGKEIRLQISRYHSDFAYEDILDETKYLIKKSNAKPEKFSSKIKVLFDNNEQDYFVNIINGVNKTTGEQGYLLLNEFKNKNNEAEILKDKLYKTRKEAFNSGYFKLQEFVNVDFKNYTENKKKEINKQQKLPRKLIRDFIKSCNNNDISGILKNLGKNVIFEKRINWETVLLIEGKDDFRKYVESSNPDFCGRELKIKSSWDFNKSTVTINVHFFPKINDEQIPTNTLQSRRFAFEINENIIESIIEKN